MRTWIALSALSLVAVLLAHPTSAMPPSPVLQEALQNGATAPHFLQHRAEIYQRGVNQPYDGVSFSANELDETFNAIVLLVDFDDHVAVTEPSFFDDLVFGDGTGTVNDYYSQVSYGALELISSNMPSTTGWLRMPQNYGYYVDGQNGFGDYPNNAQGLTEHAVLAADDLVDFSQYDHDGDGYVDGLFIMHAGTGAELSGSDNDIWSHKWDLPDPLLVDGVYVSTYAMQPEFWYSSGDLTIGVIAHEMGHSVFGVPDLYDYDGSSAGLGAWSLMAGGSWGGMLGDSPAHPDAWSRVQMGYVEPVVVTGDMDGVVMPPIFHEPVVYRLWTNGEMGDEYYLIENRQDIGYDSSLPGSGLLIYHVDDSVEWYGGNDNEWYPGHTDDGHYHVALEQADGLFELEQYGWADNTDPYFMWGNTEFNASTLPSSNNYLDEETGVVVSVIEAIAEDITVDLQVGNLSPVTVALTPHSTPIVIPAIGGSFFFDALISNTLSTPHTGHVWTDVLLPNGNTFHIQTYTVQFQPGIPIATSFVQQNVPGGAPAGAYEYVVSAGYYPNFVAHSASFPFVKLSGQGPEAPDDAPQPWTVELNRVQR